MKSLGASTWIEIGSELLTDSLLTVNVFESICFMPLEDSSGKAAHSEEDSGMGSMWLSPFIEFLPLSSLLVNVVLLFSIASLTVHNTGNPFKIAIVIPFLFFLTLSEGNAESAQVPGHISEMCQSEAR